MSARVVFLIRTACTVLPLLRVAASVFFGFLGLALQNKVNQCPNMQI